MASGDNYLKSYNISTDILRRHWDEFIEVFKRQAVEAHVDMANMYQIYTQHLWNNTRDNIVDSFQLHCSQKIDLPVIRNIQTLYLITSASLLALVGGIIFYICGYGLSQGKDDMGLYGTTYFALTGIHKDVSEADYHIALSSELGKFYFQYSFSMTVNSILSMLALGRINHVVCLWQTVILGGFIVPLIIHWAWSDNGWMKQGFSSYIDHNDFQDNRISFVDDAGSAVIHVCGGAAALAAGIVLGKRKAENNNISVEATAPIWFFIGYIILMIGYASFNGFEYYIHQHIFDMTEAEQICQANEIFLSMANAFLSAFSGGLVAIFGSLIFFQKEIESFHGLISICTCSVAGQVSISAGCSRYSPPVGCLISICGGIICFAWHEFTKETSRIKDPLNVIGTHLLPGILGIIAVCLFGRLDKRRKFVTFFYSLNDKNLLQIATLQLIWNALCVVVIFLCSFLTIFAIYSVSEVHLYLRSKIDEVEYIAEKLNLSNQSTETLLNIVHDKQIMRNTSGPPKRDVLFQDKEIWNGIAAMETVTENNYSNPFRRRR